MKRLILAISLLLAVQWLGSAIFEVSIGDFKMAVGCLLLGLFFLFLADRQIRTVAAPAETEPSVKCPPHKWSYDQTTSAWSCLRPNCTDTPG